MSRHRSAGPLVVEPGTVFGFRTSPLFDDSPRETGRYGAVVALAHHEDIVAIGVLADVWTSMPTVDDVQNRKLLRCNRFSFSNLVAAIGCAVDDVPMLDAFTEIGQVELTAEQRRIGKKYMSDNPVGKRYGSSSGVSSDVEGEWRWKHDRDALMHEYDLEKNRKEQARIRAQERYETRLKALTWEQLLSENPFENWSPSPPYPPEEFRLAAARRVHSAYRALQALGVKPRKPDTRKILKDLVLWFNDADEQAAEVIETEEREDICLVLEEIAHVARHPSLLEEVEAWREW